ncbi:putative PHD type zinc finger protein with BAH domain-containing protein, partial [Ascosphaera aggregata]
MKCVDPPLTRKPQRGFAWTCAACSRARERKMEARKTPLPILNRRDGLGVLAETESNADDMDVDTPDTGAAPTTPAGGGNSQADSNESDTPAAVNEPTTASIPTIPLDEPLKLTPEQQRQSQLWPFRYFGVHSRPEDVLDFDDRINPRAKSRQGKKHQADVPPWHNHPVVYVKRKKKNGRNNGGGGGGGGNNDGRNSLADVDWPGKAAGAPPPEWIMEEPIGYIPRGEDEPVMVNGKEVKTAELLWRPPADEFLREKESRQSERFPESRERGKPPPPTIPEDDEDIDMEREETVQGLDNTGTTTTTTAEQRLSKFMD